MTTPRRGFQPRSRRTVDWGIGPSTIGASTSVFGNLLWATGTSPTQNLTVVRTRGLVTVTLTAAASAGDGFKGAHGIFMMTDASFAIGVTAAMSPLTESNSDMWLWHSFFDVWSVTATLSDGVNAVGAVHRIVIDSKAMRKDFDPTRVMVGVTEFVESGTATAEVTAETRQLFKT